MTTWMAHVRFFPRLSYSASMKQWSGEVSASNPDHAARLAVERTKPLHMQLSRIELTLDRVRSGR